MASDNKVISFRTPQQKEITHQMYTALVNYLYGDTQDRGATLPLSLMYADSPEKVNDVMKYMPMVYTLNAPTGFGKSAISLEPLRWLTRNSLGQSDNVDAPRIVPEEVIQLVSAQQELTDGEVREELAKSNVFPKVWMTPEVLNEFLATYSPETGVLPFALSDGAVAAVVRTRSQTQAFLREAERLEAKAIALPSKASLCLKDRCLCSESDLLDDLQFHSGKNLSIIRSELSNITTTTQVDAPSNFFTNDPNTLRLASRCGESCSKCPMNLKHIRNSLNSLESGATDVIKGVLADSLNIQVDYGVPSESEYLNFISRCQSETKDLEESEILIRRQYPNLCPYPTVRDNLPEFNFVILTYPYVFNPAVAYPMADYLGHIRHVIVDEAHNIQTLFQGLSSDIYLGEKYYTKVNDALVKYESELEILSKGKMSQGTLFSKSKIMDSSFIEDVDTFLSTFYSKKDVELNDKNQIYYLHRALMAENNYKRLSAPALLQLKKFIDPIVYYFIPFFANVQTQYINFWTGLWERYPEERDIPAGMEINPADILTILFGEFKGSFKNNDMDSQDGVERPFPIYSHASQNKCAKYRAKLGDMRTFVTLFKQLKTWRCSELLQSLADSSESESRKAVKLMANIVEAIYEKASSILKLCGVLINNFPEEISNWRIYQQISNNDFEKIFLDTNIGLMSIEELQSFKSYFLQNSVDLDMLSAMVSKYAIESEDANSLENIQLKEYFENFLLKVNGDEDIEVSLAYDAFNKLKTAYPEMPLTEVPMLRYEGKFPPYMWKLYYRYWQDNFQICPLTLGRLLCTAFNNYSTVGLLSGTFQDPRYMQVFWGVTPYGFNVTETVGKKTTKVVKGLSSKYAEREASYPKFAKLAYFIFKDECQKNLLIAVPSTEFLKTFITHLEKLVPQHLMWPNSRILNLDSMGGDSQDSTVLEVNDMLEAVKEANELGVKKIFITVMGSRFTEGVEYVDSEGKSMIDAIQICGIPFSSPDIFQDDQQNHSKVTLQLNDSQAFELIQTYAAFQKVRQTIGRGIRSNKDNLTVFLADNRYDTAFWWHNLPAETVEFRPELEQDVQSELFSMRQVVKPVDPVQESSMTPWEDEDPLSEFYSDFDDDIPF